MPGLSLYELQNRIGRRGRQGDCSDEKGNVLSFNKLVSILRELSEHPRTGTGHPEPLRGFNGLTWSRRLSKKDRIVYNIEDDRIIVAIVQVGGHYSDK